jgi:fumarate reductase flavoprotein subunit
MGDGEMIKTDVAVIGSGVAGLAAALTAAEGGARAIILEKQRSLGGTSNFFEGIFAAESELQKNEYITYSRDDAFQAMMKYSHWRSNPLLVRAIVNESAESISWLQQLGVEFKMWHNIPDSPRTYHLIKGEGSTVIKALASRAKEKRVEIRLGTIVKRILKQGDKITGLIAEADEQELQVSAPVVLVATGGYINNKDWVKKYAGLDLGVNLMPFGNVDKMGEGIRMAWEAGAAEEGMGILELLRMGPVGPETINKGNLTCAAGQPTIWVDMQGKRFCDESVTFDETAVGNICAKYKERYSYNLFDESIKEYWMKSGIDKNLARENPPGTRLTNLDMEIKSALEKGNKEVFVAGSIEELAGKMGIDPAVLKATVNEYNQFCHKHHDDTFAKDPKYLQPLTRPNFYAIKAYTASLGTLGGIKINQRAEALDKNGKVIPGLYAAGNDAGGMWGDSYSFIVNSGGCSAFALNSGRIAGKNILKYLGK